MNPRIMSEPSSIKDATVQIQDAAEDLQFRAAMLISRYAPRGKEALVRWLARKAWRRQPVKLRTPRGSWIATDPGNLDLYTRLARLGGWDEEVLQCCLDLIEEGHSFFDIGANAGYMTIEVAAACHGNVDIAAFEPQPSLALAIRLSADLNAFERVTVFNVMLGKDDGTGTLYLSSNAMHASSAARHGAKKSIACVRRNLADLVGKGICRPPDLIKIDVEGGELEILSSAREVLIETQPAIIFECDENMERFGYARQDLLDCLAGCGYRDFFYIHEDRHYSVLNAMADSARNIVALPPWRSTARFRAKVRT